MRLTTFEGHDFSVARAAQEVAEILQPRLMSVVTVPEVVAETGLSFEMARDALAYLALRTNARVTWKGDAEAYIFTDVSATLTDALPTSFGAFGRYATDLIGSQIAYAFGALVALGPFFVGTAMFLNGLPTRDVFPLLAGGTLAFGSASLILMFALRTITVVLPPLVVAAIAFGWDRWTSADLYWIPLVLVVAITMQLDMLWRFRDARPDEALRTMFWGKGFKRPLTDRKRLVELIVSLDGVVTTGDLMRAFGWGASEAGEQLSAILLEYGGDIDVDENGHMVLFFDELAEAQTRVKRPTPAYQRERQPPGPFAGLDLGWIVVISIACLIGLFASPLNSTYTALVSGIDVTLEGVGLLIRRGLAGLFTIPLFIYIGRLVFNVMDRGEFAQRRKFLDAMEYADRYASGSHVAPDKFTNEELHKLNAYIDEERAIEGALWIHFPDLEQVDRERPVQGETVFEAFSASEDAQSEPAAVSMEEEKTQEVVAPAWRK